MALFKNVQPLSRLFSSRIGNGIEKSLKVEYGLWSGIRLTTQVRHTEPEVGDLGESQRLLLGGDDQVQHTLFNGRLDGGEDLDVLDLLLVVDGVAGGAVQVAHHHLLNAALWFWIRSHKKLYVR